MKVAKLYSFTDIRIEEMPTPTIGSGDALLKTAACGICSGDVMPWYIEKKAPVVIGHEPAGTIVDIGSDVADLFSKGDRVFVHHHAPCMSCLCCERGDHVQCETWRKTSLFPGGIAEYVLVSETNLRNDTLLLPPYVSFEDGTLVEPLACVVKSLRRARIRKGDTILIIGLGVMGQMHILLCREFGASRVIGADLVRYRLEQALRFGADEVIDVSQQGLVEGVARVTKGSMADIVIVGPNSADVMTQGICCVARGGTVVLFTPAKPGEVLQIDPNDLYFRDVSIVTSYSCGPDDTAQALQFIKNGAVTAEKIVTHRFPIGETEKAYRLTAEARDSLKSLIVFP